ncbi:MAG: phosphoglycerate dehydrogenase [Oscillospiraceae bacterium]|jgi:D-3-phosphoglycerate dehydrogenase|nr:phosphoglycerate dehydrogenase [Oscillospiraceae bacterium]
MFTIRTMNAISPIIGEILAGYVVSTDAESPDALIVRSAELKDYKRGAGLAAIARAGAGVNNIPVEACSAEGIVVFNTPGANANAVAELVVAAMLMTGRDILGGAEWVRTLKGRGGEVSKLVEKEKSRFTGPELRGKSLGVIGLGAIGALVANAAIALGMEVYGFDPYVSVEHAWALSRSVKRVTDREELVRSSDFITIHIPLTKDTRGLFNANMYAKMKEGATLLNFARGELADCEDTIEALRLGRLRAYATDFPCDEMLGVPGILALPHLGASTPESEENCAKMAAEQLRDFLEYGVIRNSVNLPDVELPRSKANRVTIVHRNTPGMLGAITGVLSADQVNIANLTNTSRGELAYTALDIDGAFTSAQVAKLGGLEHVLRVRVIAAHPRLREGD